MKIVQTNNDFLSYMSFLSKMSFWWPTCFECLALFCFKRPPSKDRSNYYLSMWLFYNEKRICILYLYFYFVWIRTEMINYRAILLAKLWINIFSISIAVYKQENLECLPSSWLKNAFNSSHSLCRKDLYIYMSWHLVIKSL